MSLQVCHCGWSKVTTYHGLRTHQGKKGCTPRGMSIPENQQPNYFQRYAYMGPPIEVQEPFLFQDILKINTGGKSLQRCHCGWTTLGTSRELETHQASTDCSSRRPRIREIHQTRPLQILPAPPVTTQASPPTPTVRDTIVSAFETPPISRQTTRSSERVRRSLDFFTGEQQVDTLWEHPTTAAEDRRVQQMEKDLKEKRKKEQRRQKEIKERKKADFELRIRIAEHKILEVQSSAGVCEDCLDAEMLQIDDVFSEVIQLVEEARREALQPLKERKKKVQKEAKNLVNNLQRDIQMYEDAIEELDGNVVVRALTSPDDSRDRGNASVDTSLSFGTLRATTSAMIRRIKQEVENLTPVELKRIRTFAVDVTLDPTTAHHSLLVSDDGKEVRGGGGGGESDARSLHTPGGFDMFGSVLGVQSVASGRAYWEVEVGDKSGWDLGVTRRRANRKGRLLLDPEHGYWVLVHYEGEKYAALAPPAVSLRLAEKPDRVGVFVDYEEGLVSFYDVTARSHIYSFTECWFRDEILPYFSPHPKVDDTNAAPLIISLV